MKKKKTKKSKNQKKRKNRDLVILAAFRNEVDLKTKVQQDKTKYTNKNRKQNTKNNMLKNLECFE